MAATSIAHLISAGESNTKVAKGHELGYISGILSLTPADMAGEGSVCPNASIQCYDACLNMSGRAAMQSVQDARKAKTLAWFHHRTAFVAQIVTELEAFERKGEREGKPVCIRLNGTSDIGWSKVRCTRDGVTYPNLMTAFPSIHFYDYTKVPSRIDGTRPANYHLTFSLSEGNDVDAKRALDAGLNVAAVLNVAKGEAMPATWGGYPVVDGDLHDFRFLDPQGGHIIGLRPKAKAKRLVPGGFLRGKDEALDMTRVPVYAATVLAHAA